MGVKRKAEVERVPVLLLGDHLLRAKSHQVDEVANYINEDGAQQLLRALQEFRDDHGFGRAIASPQIGVLKRVIAINLGRGPFLAINPVITHRSTDMFTLWDDCMSFPDLLVKVRRHSSIDVEFYDTTGKKRTLKGCAKPLSELLQHEIDHLDGILAVDRALDKESLLWRSLYELRKSEYDRMVDYRIESTIIDKDRPDLGSGESSKADCERKGSSYHPCMVPKDLVEQAT